MVDRRYSRFPGPGESPERRSVEEQLRLCRKHAQERGWVVVSHHVDAGNAAEQEEPE